VKTVKLEVNMASTRLGWLVSVLIGCVLVAGVVLAFRVSRVGDRKFSPQVVPEDGGQIYQQRIHATETLLEGGSLDGVETGGL
jgi:hypothetical protein